MRCEDSGLCKDWRNDARALEESQSMVLACVDESLLRLCLLAIDLLLLEIEVREPQSFSCVST